MGYTEAKAIDWTKPVQMRKGGKARVVCMDAAGIQPVAALLMMGDGYETRNFGVSGATLLRNGNRPYWKTDAYPKAKEYKPDIVIIKLGSNDSKPVHKAIWGQFEKGVNKFFA